MKCPFCHHTVIEKIIDTIETTIDGKKIVIRNIPAEQCANCKEIFHDEVASKYIDREVERQLSI